MIKVKLQYILIVLFVFSYLSKTFSQTDVHTYGFIHSLVFHSAGPGPAITTAPYWISDIASYEENENNYAFNGKFGQLYDHVTSLESLETQTPESQSSLAQLGIGGAGIETWDADSMIPFSETTINSILITPANFIQHSGPTEHDASDPNTGDDNTSITQKTEFIFDWVSNEKENLRYYIYGNWPEINEDYPPSDETIAAYHANTISGDFNTWFNDYQDAINSIEVANGKSYNTKLIPVGRIISQIYTQILPNEIDFTELYEDNAPHGTHNTYFLAGLITYMALFEQQVPQNYVPSTDDVTVHEDIVSNLTTINDFIWQELNNFNFDNGESRVFYSDTTLSTDENNIEISNIFPNPVENSFNIKLPTNEKYDVTIFDSNGKLIKSFFKIVNSNQIMVNNFTTGIYYLQITNSNKEFYFEKMIKK